MSLQSVSISSRSASRHARSCGESTSTPSTSKMRALEAVVRGHRFPSGSYSWLALRPSAKVCRFLGAQLDPPSSPDPHLDRPARALGIGGRRELLALERHPDRIPRNCMANASPSEPPPSRGSKDRTPSRMLLPA